MPDIVEVSTKRGLQPDEVENRLGDMTKDLVSIVRGDSSGVSDLAEDLRVWPSTPQGRDGSAQFSSRIGEVIKGSRVTDQMAQQLAHYCWIALVGTELSEHQVETLGSDVEALLTSAGIAEEQARAAGAATRELQVANATRHRRWYEFF